MKKLQMIRCGFLGIFIFLVSACAGISQFGGASKKAEVKYPNAVTTNMRADFDQAENLYQTRQIDAAQTAYQRYIDTYPHNKLTDEAVYKQGKILFLKKDHAGSAAKFRWLDQNSPDPAYRAKANHMGGYALFKNFDYAAAVATLRKVEAEHLTAMLRMQYYSMLILATEAQGQSGDFTDEAAVRLLDLYDEQGARAQGITAPLVLSYQNVKDRVDAWLARPMRSDAFPSWLKKGVGYADYKMARTYYEEGQKGKARKLLSAFLDKNPRSEHAGAAREMLAQLGGPDKSYASGDAFKVGVLAPMGGFGEAVLRGVRCAAGEGGVCGGTENIQILVRDAGQGTALIRQGLDELAAQGVAGVISILPGAVAVEAAAYASEKKIPLLIISQKEGLMQQSSSVFQMGFSPEHQARELADIARNRGLKNVAIFYPGIPYGQKMAELFESAVTSRGGRVVAKMAYNKGSSDIFAEVGLFKKEIDLAQANPSNPDAGAGKLDAIFLPDTFQAVNSIVPALEFNQITGVTLIGTNTWNDPALSGRIATNFPGSYFVDVYDASASGGEISDFKQNFSSSFGSDPQVLNALGYDAMKMMMAVAKTEGVDKMGDGLGGRVGYNGVTGIAGFKRGEGPIIRPKIISVDRFAGDGGSIPVASGPQ